jgi:hypothetical protein
MSMAAPTDTMTNQAITSSVLQQIGALWCYGTYGKSNEFLMTILASVHSLKHARTWDCMLKLQLRKMSDMPPRHVGTFNVRQILENYLFLTVNYCNRYFGLRQNGRYNDKKTANTSYEWSKTSTSKRWACKSNVRGNVNVLPFPPPNASSPSSTIWLGAPMPCCCHWVRKHDKPVVYGVAIAGCQKHMNLENESNFFSNGASISMRGSLSQL